MTDKDRICEMMMRPWPKATDKIQTTHLLLISSHQDLAEQCASYYKRNGEFLKGFEPEREASFFTEKWQGQILRQEMGARRRREGFAYYLFQKEEPEQMIGKISLNHVIWGGFCSCFLGYKMDREQQGKGYMTEAVREMVSFAFERVGLHRIEANIMPGNIASRRVLEKCGFESEGMAKKYLKVNGAWEDHVHMVKRNQAIE